MQTSPIILAIDSSIGSCSTAIWKNNQISAYCEEPERGMQARNLILMVEEALKKSGTAYRELNSVACTIGPGSFTGIRIGLAAARGIGFTANIPVLGFSSLAVLAYGLSQQAEKFPIYAAINAGKGETIYQYFGKNLTIESQPKLVAQALAPEAFGGIKSPCADLLAGLAAHYPGHAVPPVPFYVRPPDAKLPGNIHVTN